MKNVACLVAGCAAALAAPAFAQSEPLSSRYEDRAASDARGIERQIQSLDDSIYAADRERQISPAQADAYIRKLRDIETQLLDVRSRTLGGQGDDGDRQPSAPMPEPEIDPYPNQDDLRESRQPAAPTPDFRDDSDWSNEQS